MSEAQDELINFEEEYYDLKIKTLEDEFTDFQVIYNLHTYIHTYIYSVSFTTKINASVHICLYT